MKKKSTTRGIVPTTTGGGTINESWPMNAETFFSFYMPGQYNKQENNKKSPAGSELGDSRTPINETMVNPADNTSFDRVDKLQVGVWTNETDKQPNSSDSISTMPFDFRGAGASTEPIDGTGSGGQVVPQRGQQPYPEAFGKKQVTTTPVNGWAQDDSALGEQDELDTEASVIGDVKGKVNGKVTDSNFNATRSARASYVGFSLERTAASLMSGTTDTFTGNARRNDQSPWSNEGNNLTSYTKQEKEVIEETGLSQTQPLNTAIPQPFETRVLRPEDIASGATFTTMDAFIFPIDMNIETDKSKLKGDK